MTSLPPTLITGAANRIGRAMARGIARKGAQVCIHYNRSADAAHELVKAIRSDGGTAQAVGADLLDSDAVQGLVSRAAEALGAPLGLLVNNASVFVKDELGALGPDLFQTHFAIHATAPALLADALVRQLPADADGLIVNIIDQRVWALTPLFPSYTASKSALWTLTRTLAQGYAEHTAGRVRVNAIGPGPTIANERQQDEDFKAQVEGVPLGRGATLDEFGETIAYLWNARSVTGQMIALDGGQHLAWQTPDVVNANE